MVKYLVRLNTAERTPVLALVNTGRAAAATLLHARLLRKADGSEGSRRGTDAALAEALDTSEATVHRGRQAWVAQGLAAALSRKRPTGRPDRQLDGAQEAQRSAVACRAPPAGRVWWPLP